MSHPGDQANLINSDGSINARGVVRFARYRFKANDSVQMTNRERASELRDARTFAWDRAKSMASAHPANRAAVLAASVTVSAFGKQGASIRSAF